MKTNERKIGNITVILPNGDKWMDQCKEGEDGWDFSDDVLQKGQLVKRNVSWKDVERYWRAEEEGTTGELMKKEVSFEEMREKIYCNIEKESDGWKSAKIKVCKVKYMENQYAFGKLLPEVILIADEVNGEIPPTGKAEFSLVRKSIIDAMLPYLPLAEGKTFTVGYTCGNSGCRIWRISPT
jgi:hypothetical protein